MQECLASLVNDKVDNGTDGHEHASTVFHKYVGADFEELQIAIKAKTGCILFSERWLSWITDVHKGLYKEQEVSSSSKAGKSRSLFKGRDTSKKHPNTTITKLYSSNNSLTLISLCSLEWLGWFRCMSSRARCSIVKADSADEHV